MSIELIQRGVCFAFAQSLTLASGGTQTFVGIPDAVPVTFVFMSIEADGGPLMVELIEAPTVTAPGTKVTAYNRNRLSTEPHRMAIYGDAVVTGGDVLIERELYGSTSGAVAATSVGALEGEWVLDPAKTYAIRITNDSSPPLAVDMTVEFLFHEILTSVHF